MEIIIIIIVIIIIIIIIIIMIIIMSLFYKDNIFSKHTNLGPLKSKNTYQSDVSMM